MNTITKAIVSLLAITTSASAGWIASIYPENSGYPGMARIQYSAERSEGDATFGEALKQLEKQGLLDRLKTITIHLFFREADFQKELFSALERSVPTALQEALQSSGNVNNPKIRKLYKPFMEAVLVTTMVKEISSALDGHSLKIAGASGEKFMLFKEKDQLRFFCGLILEIEKVAEPNAPGNSR